MKVRINIAPVVLGLVLGCAATPGPPEASRSDAEGSPDPVRAAALANQTKYPFVVGDYVELGQGATFYSIPVPMEHASSIRISAISAEVIPLKPPGQNEPAEGNIVLELVQTRPALGETNITVLTAAFGRSAFFQTVSGLEIDATYTGLGVRLRTLVPGPQFMFKRLVYSVQGVATSQ